MKLSTLIAVSAVLMILLGLSCQSKALDVYDMDGNIIDDPQIAQYCIRFGPGFPLVSESTVCFHRNFWLEIKGCTLGTEENRECSKYEFIDRIVIE